MTPIEGLLAIVANLKDWVNERRDNRRVTFAQFIDPMYGEFKPIAKNYIDLFAILGRSAAEADTLDAVNAAFDQFGLNRREFESARRELEVVAETYATKLKQDDIQQFLADLCGFFYGDSALGSLSRDLQTRLEWKFRRRQEIDRRIDELCQEESQLQTRDLLSRIRLSAPVSLTDAFSSAVDRQRLEHAREMLHQEGRELREACIREAEQLTDLLHQKSKALARAFAELRLKYAS
jgi:hypothetical protein